MVIELANHTCIGLAFTYKGQMRFDESLAAFYANGFTHGRFYWRRHHVT
jgi:hypothetical protein